MPNTDWMAPFTDRWDLTLKTITFPASHDAGLHEGAGGFKSMGMIKAKDSTICQFGNIESQLNAGSRAFDLRIRANKSGELRTYHSESVADLLGQGGWGQDANSIFEQVDAFLQVHTGEIVILRISHTKEADGAHIAAKTKIAKARRYCSLTAKNLAVVSLCDLRGKALLIFDEKALATPDPANGLHRYAKYADNFNGNGLAICGKYAGLMKGTGKDSQKMREVAQTALESGNEHGEEHRKGQKPSHIFMVYWQIAWNVKHKSTQGNDERNKNLTRLDDNRGTHYNLDYLLNVHRGMPDMYHVTYDFGKKKVVNTKVSAEKRLLFRPNWINLDFVDDAVCAKVIEFNEELLRPRPVRLGG